MTEIRSLTYAHNPSALLTIWNTFWLRGHKIKLEKNIPLINLAMPDFRINPKHLMTFNKICGIKGAPFPQILYPFTLSYPFIMRLLSMKDVPVSLFTILNISNNMTLYRPVGIQESLSLECRISDIRLIPKGYELDVLSEIIANGNVVWENTATYFFRGKSNLDENTNNKSKLEPIPEGDTIGQWFLPAKDRFRFARISGDTNGIHYNKWYARLMGFKRDFAQPIRVVAKCVDVLPPLPEKWPLNLYFLLKGPAYYENNLFLKIKSTQNSHRFDLFQEGNDRPCICGTLSIDSLVTTRHTLHSTKNGG